jgi:hypothetical protein
MSITIIITLPSGTKLVLDGDTETATFLGRGEHCTMSLAALERTLKERVIDGS